jgi:hypothetical protein
MLPSLKFIMGSNYKSYYICYLEKLQNQVCCHFLKVCDLPFGNCVHMFCVVASPPFFYHYQLHKNLKAVNLLGIWLSITQITFHILLLHFILLLKTFFIISRQ